MRIANGVGVACVLAALVGCAAPSPEKVCDRAVEVASEVPVQRCREVMTDLKSSSPQEYDRHAKCIVRANNDASLKECLDGGPELGPPPTPAEADWDRVRQCTGLIKVINEEQGKHGNAAGDTPEDLKTLGDALDGTAKRIGDVQLRDEKLKAFRGEYKKMSEDLANAARDTATAGDDSEKRNAAITVMRGIGPREDKLVGDINVYCQVGG
jgi:hypothetical protein